jgi:hypothetical protein
VTGLLAGALLAVALVAGALAVVCGPWWLAGVRARWTVKRVGDLFSAEVEGYVRFAAEYEDDPS